MGIVIDESLDGTGGGYGRYRGATLSEIARQLEACLKDPTMRGASAVLRIAHEQLDARGGIGTYPHLLWFSSGALALLLIAKPLVPDKLAELLLRAQLVALAGVGMFGWVSWSLRLARRKAIYQERMIRTMCLDALNQIAESSDFRARPLDLTQRLVLTRMLKATKRQDALLVAMLEQA